MPPDDNIPGYVIEVKEGKISRLYVAMCGLCHGTVTTSVPAREIFEADLMLAGWEQIKGVWFCQECC